MMKHSNQSSTARSIGIVGGGVGGMVTALLMQQKGCQVTIYEAQPRLGGRLAFHQRSDVRIDQGPTIVLLPEMLLSILEEAGIARDRLDLIPCDPMVRFHFDDGTIFNKYQDEQRQAEEIEQQFPGEGRHFSRYMQDLREVYREAKPVFLERAFLSRFASLISIRNLRTLWRAYAHISVQQLAARYFQDHHLRQAYSLQTLYIGGTPNTTPGLYSLIPFAEHEFGIWYLRGGYARLAEILSEELQKRGVQIHTNTKISKLWIEEDQCKGVEMSNCLIAHDAVVYNGDFPNIAPLITKPLLRNHTPSSGCVLLYLQANRTWEQLTTHQFLIPNTFDELMLDITKQDKIPDDPSFYVFHPQTIDETVAPADKSLLYVLIPVPSGDSIDWSVEAQPLAERVLNKLEQRLLPGLKDAIEWCDVRTPTDAQRFGLYGGGSFGLAPTWLQSGMFRPQLKAKGIDDLYAVGASIHPGGGIPIVMQGASLLAQHLVKELSL